MESVPACYYFTFVVPNQFPAKFPTFLFEEPNDPGKTILVKFHVVRAISTFHSVHFSSLVDLAVSFPRSLLRFEISLLWRSPFDFPSRIDPLPSLDQSNARYGKLCA